ncbi:Osmotin thaumatin-like protein [Mycena sanguinolenta]|nr:Osmotin thaumatin-like protein [Mycena sanguinolenta]
MNSVIALSTAMASTAAAQRTMTVHNACPFTVWKACFNSLFTSTGTIPAQTTRWVADASTTYWLHGRIWGRLDYDFSTNPGPSSCLDGGCNGGLVCDVNTGTGVPPSTLAEFNFNGGGNDWYDVSLVDGFNLPMRIDNNVGCDVASCPVDLGPDCAYTVTRAMTELNFGIRAPPLCRARSTPPDRPNSPKCCSGQYHTAATCPPSGVTDYSYFKDNCPDADAYAYDESSGTALWSCTSSLNAAYAITFCP